MKADMNDRANWPSPALHLAGEGAVHVSFEQLPPARAPDAVLALDRALGQALEHACGRGSVQGGDPRSPNAAEDLPFPPDLAKAVIERVPAIRSLAILFDPEACRGPDMLAALERFIEGGTWQGVRATSGRTWRIPAVYGGAAGPDLEAFAEAAGTTPEALVCAHSSSVQRVTMLGFAPGSAYLDGLPPLFDVPRRRTLRPIPEGAIILALRQSVITTVPMPTGWYHVATTPLPLFDPARSWPFLLAPADKVQFVPMSEEEAAALDPDPWWEQVEGAR